LWSRNTPTSPPLTTMSESPGATAVELHWRAPTLRLRRVICASWLPAEPGLHTAA
jgi:hypothetical protein